MFGIKNLKHQLLILEDQVEILEVKLRKIEVNEYMNKITPKFKKGDKVLYVQTGDGYRNNTEGIIVKEATPQGFNRVYWVDFPFKEIKEIWEEDLELCKK